MPRFFFGDELGNVKALRYSVQVAAEPQESKCSVDVVVKGSGTRSTQSLSVGPKNGEDNDLLVALYSDGSGSCLSLNPEDPCTVLYEWKDPVPADQKYVGLAARATGIYSCTSSGALRFMSLPKNDSSFTSRSTCIPKRLYDWRLSADEETFAYGGYEVDLSVWDMEKAFTTDVSTYSGQKKNSNASLFPAEIWRAKHVKNDSLGLRQPVRITTLTYLGPSDSSSAHHLLAGTQYGELWRYDTRTARKPVAEWKGMGKGGSVRRIEKGLREHELFVSDNNSSLFALDLRNGKIAYSYKGIAGTVTSIAPSCGILASVSLDRFARIHSTFSLPSEISKQQEHKGEKVFVHSIPTVIVWDGNTRSTLTLESEGGAEDIWSTMKNVRDEDDSDSTDIPRQGKRKKRRTG